MFGGALALMASVHLTAAEWEPLAVHTVVADPSGTHSGANSDIDTRLSMVSEKLSLLLAISTEVSGCTVTKLCDLRAWQAYQNRDCITIPLSRSMESQLT